MPTESPCVKQCPAEVVHDKLIESRLPFNPIRILAMGVNVMRNEFKRGIGTCDMPETGIPDQSCVQRAQCLARRYGVEYTPPETQA